MNDNSPLGKGLSALISEEAVGNSSQGYVPEMKLDKIIPNPQQPRLNISPESLIELADSIREHGIVEPLIVSKRGDKYMLVAGERRWRAAQLAKVDTVPVVIKETSQRQMLEMAIVENVQRKDLNALEEALALQQLHDDYGLSFPEISKKIGISRPAVSNKIRLLGLPIAVKEALINEKISEGHARALLGITNPDAMVAALRIVLRDKASVRTTEELVRRLAYEEKKYTNKAKAEKIWSPRVVEIKDSFARYFDSEVKLTRSRLGGKIIIPFKNDEELEAIHSKLQTE